MFASNKNTVKPNGELHTNFALSAGGEFLALVDTNGTTILDQYTPGFPAQFEDISYGRAMENFGAPTTLARQPAPPPRRSCPPTAASAPPGATSTSTMRPGRFPDRPASATKTIPATRSTTRA